VIAAKNSAAFAQEDSAKEKFRNECVREMDWRSGTKKMSEEIQTASREKIISRAA
jgi:hypothetical protein